MLDKKSILWRALNICSMILFILFLILFIGILIWFINFFADYWLHHKSSPEVDGALINALIGAITVFLTIGISLWFNLKTQELMEKQLEINEQQTRTSLRDLVFQKRLEFYLEIIEKIHKIKDKQFEAVSDEGYKKFSELLDELEELIDKKEGIASKNLGVFFLEYKHHILRFDPRNNYADWEDLVELNEILNDIEYIINLELYIDKIDSDIYSLIDESAKEKIERRLMEVSKRSNKKLDSLHV